MPAHAKVTKPIVFRDEVHRRIQTENVAAFCVAFVAYQHHIFVTRLVTFVAKGIRIHDDYVQFIQLLLNLQIPLIQKLRSHKIITHKKTQQFALNFANRTRTRPLGPAKDAVFAVFMVAIQHSPFFCQVFHANHAWILLGTHCRGLGFVF